MYSISIWLWFLGIWVVSQITKSVLSRSRGLICGIFNVLFFIGVFVHEFSHLIFCFILRVPTSGMSFQFIDRSSGMVNPAGSVGVVEGPRISMMQSLMIAFAPLFVSTFLLMGCLDVIFTFKTTFEIQVIMIILAISILFTAAPSGGDISNILNAATGDPLQSFLQFLIALVSLLISINIVDLSSIILPLEVLYYVSYFAFSIVIYLITILFCRIISVIFRRVFPSGNYSSKQITRKRHRPKKPPKNERGSW